MTKVLIAVDETDASTIAVKRARELFGADAEYLAINVFEAPAASVPPLANPIPWGAVWRYDVYGGSADDVETARRIAEQEAMATTKEAGFAADQAIGETGDAAEAILRAAHDHGVDVIVVGSHQHNWFSRLFSRSVSTDVLHHSDIPVLVAK